MDCPPTRCFAYCRVKMILCGSALQPALFVLMVQALPRYTTKNGMSYNRIARMKEDKEGRIWCLNIDGSVNFIYKGKVFNEKNAPFLSEIKNRLFITTIYFKTKTQPYTYIMAPEKFRL